MKATCIFDYDIYIGNQVIFYDAGDDLERSAAIPSWDARLESDLHNGSSQFGRPRMARYKLSLPQTTQRS
jgi:hypothetical protein